MPCCRKGANWRIFEIDRLNLFDDAISKAGYADRVKHAAHIVTESNVTNDPEFQLKESGVELIDQPRLNLSCAASPVQAAFDTTFPGTNEPEHFHLLEIVLV